MCSLQSLANELKYRKGELYANPFVSKDGSRWRCSSEVVSAAWRLVRLCDEENFTDMRDLAGISLAAVRIYYRCIWCRVWDIWMPSVNRRVWGSLTRFALSQKYWLNLISLRLLFIFWQVGMGDPHAVVFHLPEESGEDSSQASNITEVTSLAELGAPDNLVKQIMLQMRGYLVDNNVQIIELTSRTLKVSSLWFWRF